MGKWHKRILGQMTDENLETNTADGGQGGRTAARKTSHRSREDRQNSKGPPGRFNRTKTAEANGWDGCALDFRAMYTDPSGSGALPILDSLACIWHLLRITLKQQQKSQS